MIIRHTLLPIGTSFLVGVAAAPWAVAQELDPADREAFRSALREVRIDPSRGADIWPIGPRGFTERGAPPTEFVDHFEDFELHPLSDDPIFDRFQVLPGEGQVDPVFSWQLFNGVNAIPSLFMEGQTDEFGTPDPLPRWQGTALIESIPPTAADINGDGVVDTADLGQLIAAFGNTGASVTGDINGDEIVDTADLGLLIGAFGSTVGPFCVYEATVVHTTDDLGNPLPPGALDDGPFIGDRIAFDASGACGECDTFRLAIDGVDIFGEWTLIDTEAQDLTGVAFYGEVESVGCPGWGDDRVLALVRGETGEVKPDFFFFNVSGGRVMDFVMATPSSDLICEADVFLPSHESVHWSDFITELENSTASRIFSGGVAAGYGGEFVGFGNQEGLLDRFMILGKDCGVPFCGSTGGLYVTAPDPDYVDPDTGVPTPLPGKKSLAGEWFTLRHVITRDFEHEVWLRDSETIQLIDPQPGDDGGATASVQDDIEDGFAKIYPVGPYGRTRLGSGHIASVTEEPIATTATRFRTLYGQEDGELPRADRNQFIDNIRITGLTPLIDAPPLELPYADGLEAYEQVPAYEGGRLRYLTAGRWTSTEVGEVAFDDTLVRDGQFALQHRDATSSDEQYVAEFWTELPRATAGPGAPWRVGVWFAFSPVPDVRGIAPVDTVADEAACTVLTGVVVPFSSPDVVDTDSKTGLSRLHVRQPNPHFEPGSPVDDWPAYWGPPAGVPGDPGYPNIEFINVPTDALVGAEDTYHHVEVEVNDAGLLRVFIDGVERFPADPDRFYETTPGDITEFSAGAMTIDRLRFETANRSLLSFFVDDVTLTGQAAP